jgi:hypothetical protein
MIHIQKPVSGWLEAVARLPAGSCVLAVDQVQESMAVKNTNPNVTFALRHYYDEGQQNDGGWDGRVQRSREFFATFIDGTFDHYAQYVDFVLEFNEYFADSQDDNERAAWIDQARAHAWVWHHEYRTNPLYSHIRLVLANTAVGNDVPEGIAHIYQDYYPGVVVGYHPYSLWQNGVRAGYDWNDLSGRWARNEAAWDIPVEWLFTEAGPFESAVTGWRSPECLGFDVDKYVNAVREWIQDCKTTPAYQEGRLHGFALFTTGRAGNVWKGFWTEQPELNALADMVAQEWQPVAQPPPPPPPPPPPDPTGEPRLQYNRTVRVIPPGYTIEEAHAVLDEAWADRNTVGFSYDDAGIGNLDRRTAILYGVPPGEEQQAMTAWYEEHYTGTVVEFADILPEDNTPEILDIVDELPVHPTEVYDSRPLSDITHLTIHHTVSTTTPEAIANYHISRGWPGIGYHYIIIDDGTIFQCNHLDTISYHSAYNNGFSVGVALMGNFMYTPPTQEQLDSAHALVAYLKSNLDAEIVYPHRWMPRAATACCGDTIEQNWLNYVAGQVVEPPSVGLVRRLLSAIRPAVVECSDDATP